MKLALHLCDRGKHVKQIQRVKNSQAIATGSDGQGKQFSSSSSIFRRQGLKELINKEFHPNDIWERKDTIFYYPK